MWTLVAHIIYSFNTNVNRMDSTLDPTLDVRTVNNSLRRESLHVKQWRIQMGVGEVPSVGVVQFFFHWQYLWVWWRRRNGIEWVFACQEHEKDLRRALVVGIWRLCGCGCVCVRARARERKCSQQKKSLQNTESPPLEHSHGSAHWRKTTEAKTNLLYYAVKFIAWFNGEKNLLNKQTVEVTNWRCSHTQMLIKNVLIQTVLTIYITWLVREWYRL